MNIHQIRGYCSRLLERYCKNQPTSVILFLLMILPWQIHLLISLPARLIKYIMGLLEGKYASVPPDVKVCVAEFCNFAEVTLEEIKKVFKETTI